MIIFCRGVYLTENTYQAASVRFVSQGRTNRARSRLQSFCQKRAKPFFDSLEPVTEVTGVGISRMNDSMKRILQSRKKRGKKVMERLLEILEDIQPDVDFKTRTDLIDAHLLSSLSILSLIAELEDEFDITVPAVEVIPANFNSMQAMWDMIRRLQEEG